MTTKTWRAFFAESKLMIALVLLILARCVDRVVYTSVPFVCLVIAKRTAGVSSTTTGHFCAAIPAAFSLSFRGNLANVLGQLLLPVNMIMSFFFLQTKYKRTHIFGAILVIYGGLVDMIPLMQGGGSTVNSPDPSLWWISLYLMALIPAAGSNGDSSSYSKCEGSSVLFVVSSAICLPLTDVLYMFPLLTGAKAAQAFTLHDGFAIFVLVMGMLVYHAEKEQRLDASGTKAVDKSPMFSSPSLQKTRMMRAKRGRVLYHQSPVAFRNRSSPSRALLTARSPGAAPPSYGTSMANEIV
ncbi:hypothetical protein DYB38_008118 [Aphanomyces astaci]|uniref:Uncharacterized protein n=1 Tax=Aphanomyces astaci TaxID=112090 RepID=A0A397CI29_APHAT|nr:hypothetical protein DYB38_008118 [Aphanomyces astaci]